MRFLVLILSLAPFLAQANEKVRFETEVFSILCSKPSGACDISPSHREKVEVELFADGYGNQIGRYHQQSQSADFTFGGDVLISHSKNGYYLLYITSWIQDLQPVGLRSQASVSVTVNSLADLNLLNIPSPDRENDSTYGHGQFMIWADKNSAGRP